MYDKVSTSLNFVERENEVLKFWQENKIFEKSIEAREGCPTFTFYDGPPTANGKPHIGHVLTRVMKDIIPRYRTMKGFKVLRKAGWDTHGLPVELEVEKHLGINGKPQIEKYGVEGFIKECKHSVWKYEKEWEGMSNRVGYWVDMDNPYITYNNNYIESEWWALKEIWNKGLLYKGHKIVPYCPRCGTALSSHEVAQGYKDVKEASIYVKFKVKGEENLYLMAWTTTPWTLPSNVALTVNPKEYYIKAKYKDEVYILAEALADSVLGEYENSERFLGKDILGMEYVPLFDFAQPDKKAFYVVGDDFVTLTDGTGIVHTAPAFGEDDAKVGRANDLPFVQMVDEQGKFIEEVAPWKGIFVKDADPMIIKDLGSRKLVFKVLDYEHSYPFCWRCDTPLLYYARDTWFIKMTAVRDQLLKNNKKINWLPDNIKEGRFGNFLENVIDWGLSRERYWGTPLPIWECECGHKHVIGSIKELQEMGENVPDDIELHKPYIDQVYLNCPKCKTGKMKRVSEVIDCWFDSGSMPFAQWHYPFENKEIFEDNFPADFISEAVDQTRGWFYTLLAISTLLFDEPPYKNVIVLGHVQDKDGRKMSKHLGNVVDPWTVLNKQGADAARWYFCINSAPWLPSRFYEEAVSETQRRFMGTLWNTYAFYVLYANIDRFNPMDYKLDYDTLPVMDQWVLSKLHTLIKSVDTNLADYKITEPTRVIESFVDDLSNWYVRRSRERFWAKEMIQDKIDAYMTLYTVLTELTKVIAPFVPYIAEEIYRNLVAKINREAPESVHLCSFPVVNEKYINKSLEENMDLVLKIVVSGRACRNTANIKNRQPLSKLYVNTKAKLPEMFVNVIAEELNIKEVVFTGEVKQFTKYKLKPQLKTLGPKYGKLVPKIAEALQEADGHQVVDTFESGKSITMTVDGRQVELAPGDVLVETMQAEGFVTETNQDITVVLATNLTPELIEEGFVREVISKIQNMRKEADFEVQDHIKVYYSDNEKIKRIMEDNRAIIADEVLAVEIINGTTGEGFGKDLNINGEAIKVTVVKV